jgi:DNA-binding MarR family transcriptional regulator
MGWIADLLQEIPSAARYKVQLEQLEAEHKVLESENRELRANLETAKLEINRLKQEAQEKQKENVAQNSDLPELQHKILVLLGDDAMETSEIASRIGKSTETAKFHLDELHQAEFVRFSVNLDWQTIWSLRQEGRRYLVQRDLLK